jgi:sugar lactone lactonase YvrE
MRYKSGSVFLLAAAGVFVAGTARAAPLFAGNGNGGLNPGALIAVNDATGAGSVIGDPITPGGLSGLAFNSAGLLYGTTAGSGTSNLVLINPATGTLVSTIGNIGFTIGDLSFQPGTDILYGIRSNSGGPGGGLLYTIDTTTGAATLVGNTQTGTGGGIAFAPDGTLYHTGHHFQGDFTALNTLNPATGQVLTTVAINGFFDGLAVRGDGVVFAAPGGGGDGIFTINKTTGALSLVGFTGTGGASDLAFQPATTVVPEPASLVTFGLGVIGVLGYRVRRRTPAA